MLIKVRGEKSFEKSFILLKGSMSTNFSFKGMLKLTANFSILHKGLTNFLFYSRENKYI